MKKCSKCIQSKLFNEFHSNNYSPDGYHSQCKLCYNNQKKLKYADNSKEHYFKQEEKRKRNRLFVNNYLESCSCNICGNDRFSTLKIYNNLNEPTIYAMIQRCYSLNKISAALKKCRVICANCHAQEIYENYKEKSLIKRREYKRTYEKKRKENDPVFKIRKQISAVIRRSFSTKNIKKNNSTWKILSYSKEELKIHIESLFESWMNWNNWGIYNPKTWNDNDQSTWTWQIDHIVPASSFNYISMNDLSFQKCWALTNLRPLSSKQNIKDGNRR